LAYSSCGKYGRVFGGYGKFGLKKQVSKTYRWTNFAHYGLLVTIKFLKIDSWDDSDWVDVYIGGNKQSTIKSSNEDGLSHICGQSESWMDGIPYNERMFDLSYIITSHSSDSVEIKFLSNFDESLTNESWGIKEIYIYLKMCDTLCLTCFGSLSSECSTCHTNARISDGSCYCRNYYYLKEETLPCSSGPCAKCTRCHIGCKTCSGPSISNCLSCETQDAFSSSDKTCTYPNSNIHIINMKRI
jgi:hypothetical protein